MQLKTVEPAVFHRSHFGVSVNGEPQATNDEGVETCSGNRARHSTNYMES